VSNAAGLKVALVGINSPGYHSLALGYLRAYAQADPRLGDVAFATLDLDTTVDPWWIAYRVIGLEPDVVGFSVVCWNARAVFEAARLVKAACPEATIVMGGPEIGPMAEEALARHPECDAVVRGEGEATFAELLATMLRGRDVSRVDGVTARREGRIVEAPDRALIADLDSVPSPYLTGILPIADGGTYLETYRGCPHRCAYCFEGKGYGRLRHFSKERIAAEIELVAADPSVRSFSFIDPIFNLTEERLVWLADTLEPHATRGLRLHTIEVDVERVDARQAAQLKRTGVASVETGPQSVGQAALATCNRHFDRGRFAGGVAALRAEGISVETDLIIGLPGDTFDDIVDGVDFVIGLDPGTVQISTLHVLPGTELWTRAGELGLLFDPEPPHEVIATSEMTFSDLRRAEVFAASAAKVYRSKLG
jgi:radical SAM superfamily enzyme YgiQ (UPF0313 family)